MFIAYLWLLCCLYYLSSVEKVGRLVQHTKAVIFQGSMLNPYIKSNLKKRGRVVLGHPGIQIQN